MFGMTSKPTAAYAQVGIETGVMSADPHKLILMLFDGAKAALIAARAGIEQGNIAEKGLSISKAIDIINNGLKASLDMTAGGDLAEKLAALYDYMCQRLLWANLKNDVATLDEISRLLAELHDAWASIAPEKLETAA